MKVAAPCGSWESLVSADMVAGSHVDVSWVEINRGDIYWLENRAAENGRCVLICRRHDGEIVDAIPKNFSIRSRVHEYGGKAFCVHEGSVFFVNDADQRIYTYNPLQIPAAPPRSLTAKTKHKISYADLLYDVNRQGIISVAEQHFPGQEAKSTLVHIALDAQVRTITEGADFYAMPALSPDGNRLSWIEWSHPDMPWDATRCIEVELDRDARIKSTKSIQKGTEAIFQPSYAPDGQLYYISDRSGYWNLYRDGDERHYALDADCGLPHWVFGMRSYGFVDAQTALVTTCRKGIWYLNILNLVSGEFREFKGPWCAFSGLQLDNGQAAFVAEQKQKPACVVHLDVKRKTYETVFSTMVNCLHMDDISMAESFSFRGFQDQKSYAFYYPPTHSKYCVPDGEKPPLIVLSHGGPTAQSSAGFSIKKQFWTNRGFALCDVNYSGSTGFGKAYRERLKGQWGIADVADCIAAAQHLVQEGFADRERLIIAGGSAGGFTALNALTFHNIFKAGRSSYGIADLSALVRDTHKFERHYLKSLVGAWPGDAEIYRARSALFHTQHLNCPILFLQGSDDKVVPPAQAEVMVDTLRRKNLAVAYELYDNEGHGFRQAETICRAYQGELSFYAQIFNIPLHDSIPKIFIENLKK